MLVVHIVRDYVPPNVAARNATEWYAARSPLTQDRTKRRDMTCSICVLCACIYIYIYIYRERERDVYAHISLSIYIYL